MAYIKTNWQTGDIVTAEKLNHLENGVSVGGTLIVHFVKTYNSNTGTTTVTSDKTGIEIAEALESGQTVLGAEVSEYSTTFYNLEQYSIELNGEKFFRFGNMDLRYNSDTEKYSIFKNSINIWGHADGTDELNSGWEQTNI